jgi:predicted amidohydrolase
VAQADADETVLVADVDIACASARRRRLPLLRDLRPDLLAAELERLARAARA